MCATIAEAIQDIIVITGTLLIYYTHANVLIGSSSMHAFIAKIFVIRAGMSIEDLGYDLVMSTLA